MVETMKMIGWMQPTWTPAMISRQKPTKIPSLRTTPGGERTPGRLTLGILGRGVPASGLQPAGKTIAGVPTRPRAAGDPHFKISRRISRPNWREPYTSPCQARISIWKSLLQRRKPQRQRPRCGDRPCFRGQRPMRHQLLYIARRQRS